MAFVSKDVESSPIKIDSAVEEVDIWNFIGCDFVC